MNSVQAKFVKFCLVGGTGALLNFGITYGLTEWLGFWYMLSLFIATVIATVWNFTFNYYWTFAAEKKHSDADYDWWAYHNGNPIQKFWKRSIANKIARMVKPGGIALDIGCGSSPLCTILPVQRYLGFDANRGKVDYMNSLNIPDTKFICRSIEELSFDITNKQNYSPVADTVICAEVIEHFGTYPEATSLVKTLNKLTRMHGTIIIATPNYESRLWNAIESLYKVMMPKAYGDGHLIGFSEDDLIFIGNNCGLRYEARDSVLGADMIIKFRKVEEVG